MRSITGTKIAALALAILALSVVSVPSAVDNRAQAGGGQPADKLAVSGSGLDSTSAEVVDGAESRELTLMTGTIKTSTPTDLIMQVTLECALWTNVVTVGNAESEAFAQVRVWVEIDGEPVPVASDDEADTGEVVFCDRTYRMETVRFENENATIRQFLRTRTANAFNWIAMDGFGDGDNVHEIVVKARLVVQESTSDNPFDEVGLAKALVGKRTLVVEPVKLAQDISV